ncbi:MAG: cyclase family protein, partial [Chloroflexi bacterium]|nr:cyclase family protein [Chloroflexota bacterium]
GDAFTLSRLTLGTHTGTHLDAPRHVWVGGKGVDELPLEVCVGRATVVDVSSCPDHLEVACLAGKVPAGCRRLLLKTQSGDTTESPKVLTPEAAAWITAQGMLLVGTDQASLDPPEGSIGAAHRLLLGAGVILVENLALEGIAPGEYDLICLPLKLRHGDGAPVRAIL